MNLYWFQFITSLIVGAIAAILADWRGRSSILWFCLGTLLGPLGLLVLLIVPKLQSVSVDPNRKEKVQEELFSHQKMSLDIASASWFYIDLPTREAKGPLRFIDLQRLWRDGLLEKSTFVWSKGLKEWMKIADLEVLYNLLQG
ncbi:MAG: DUF4339 domain-containing protein [Chlamydia sp.]